MCTSRKCLRGVVWLFWLYRTANDFWKYCRLITIAVWVNVYPCWFFFFSFKCSLFNHIFYFVFTSRHNPERQRNKSASLKAQLVVFTVLVVVAIAVCYVVYNVSRILLSLIILFQLHMFLSGVVSYFGNKHWGITLFCLV
jgi:hypothetical protein